MTMAIIGSGAAKINGISMHLNDIDLVATPKEALQFFEENKKYLLGTEVNEDRLRTFYQGRPIDIEFTKPGSSAEFLHKKLQDHSTYILNEYIPVSPKTKVVKCSQSMLYLLKKSHITIPKNWNKTVKDYNALKKYEKEVVWEKQFFDMRVNENKGLCGGKIKAKDFFLREGKVFSHKDLHKICSHYDRPLYLEISKDGELNEALFEEFNQAQKITCVLEEAYVLALEKAIAVNQDLKAIKNDPNMQSYFFSGMKKLCTRVDCEWLSNFAVENYSNIVGNYESEYWHIFNSAVKCNLIERRV